MNRAPVEAVQDGLVRLMQLVQSASERVFAGPEPVSVWACLAHCKNVSEANSAFDEWLEENGWSWLDLSLELEGLAAPITLRSRREIRPRRRELSLA